MGWYPKEILTRKALAEPHRVYAKAKDREEEYIKELRQSPKEMLKRSF